MMKKDTLYLHVGWSKTGTSAVQAQIQAQHEDFLDKGILYPQTLQWPDHSHHPFALSFQGSGAYQSDMSPAQALEKLYLEMQASPAKDILISSELSPLYFHNPKFKAFVEKYFTQVKVLFTVRPQSELLLSLFNQLVKDPNVRYGGTLFSLAMRNVEWLNFVQVIRQWHKYVSSENLYVIPYSQHVVQDFFDVFSLTPREAGVSQVSGKVVNPSLPTRCLSLVQSLGQDKIDNAEFARRKNRIIVLSENVEVKNDTHVLFSVAEQQSLDAYYQQGNKKLAEWLKVPMDYMIKSSYKNYKALPNNMFNVSDLC